MICLTTKKGLFGVAITGCVGSVGRHRSETLILASPFVLLPIIIAQARSLTLLFIRKGQTNGQRRVQNGDGIALLV